MGSNFNLAETIINNKHLILLSLNRTGFVGDHFSWENVPMKKVKYTPEIRDRAVQLLIESEKDYPSNWAAITAIAFKIKKKKKMVLD